MKKLTTRDEAVTATTQHTTPCHDCPWRRDSIRGWLGGFEPEDFVELAHSDLPVECHTIAQKECAGITIYRANVCKVPKGTSFILPVDREKVFAAPHQFVEHHNIFERDLWKKTT